MSERNLQVVDLDDYVIVDRNEYAKRQAAVERLVDAAKCVLMGAVIDEDTPVTAIANSDLLRLRHAVDRFSEAPLIDAARKEAGRG